MIAPGMKQKPPATGMPNPMGFQPQFNANGQAVNAGAMLQDYRHDSAVAQKTGTATGNRSVQDFAKGQSMQGQAAIGRQAANTNAAFQSNMQQQREQLTQQGRASRLQRFQQMTGQATDQMNLANQLARQRLEMQTNWRTAMLGLLS
jgi:hypothetical protein